MPYSKNAVPVVVFDLDGVLIDSAEANVQAFRYGLEQVGVSISDRQQILRLVGHTAAEMLAELGCPRDKVAGIFSEYVKPFYIANLPALARAYPGSREVLEQLRDSGFRLGACTSGDRHTQESALKAIGLWDLIEEMQTPDDSSFSKPDIRYLAELLERFGQFGDVHHVEDAEVGLVMGQQFGAVTYFAEYGNGQLSGAVQPDFVIQEISELPQAILNAVAVQGKGLR